MEFIIKPRQGGKTTQLKAWFMEDPSNRWVIVPTIEVAEYFGRGLTIRQREHVLTPGTASRGLQGRSGQVGVDDLDTMLHHLLGIRHAEISVVTATGSLRPDAEDVFSWRDSVEYPAVGHMPELPVDHPRGFGG